MLIKCPECGRPLSEVKVCKVCERHGGEAVCLDCCKECAYYFYNEAYIAHGCRYGVDKWHDKEETKEVILKRLDAQIGKLERKADYFYMTSRPWVAKKIEGKITRLRYERAELAIYK